MTHESIGIDVGGTKLLGVVVSDRGDVVAEARRPTPSTPGVSGATLADEIAGLVDELGSDRADAVPVGVGVPGMLSLDGLLVFSPNLPPASGTDFGELLAARLGDRAIAIANDADAAVVAEHRLGVARGYDDVVLVTLGTGIGGGVISAGRLLRGANGFAGEIGHVVVDPSGPRCPCGKRGCWERYASGAGVARLAREAAIGGRLGSIVAKVGDAEAVRGEDVTHAAANGDAEAMRVLDEVGWWLALGLANLASILDPACFVLGGGLSEASTLLVPPTTVHLEALLEAGGIRPPIPVLAAGLGARAGAVGAALLARELVA